MGNIVLNLRSRKVTLTNFCLGKHLMNENDLLKDQRGSPAYISPDVLSGKPYAGKPSGKKYELSISRNFLLFFSSFFSNSRKKNPIFSDMWALGVVLFTMLYGQFPFYDSAPHELFQSKFLWAQSFTSPSWQNRVFSFGSCLNENFHWYIKPNENSNKYKSSILSKLSKDLTEHFIQGNVPLWHHLLTEIFIQCNK